MAKNWQGICQYCGKTITGRKRKFCDGGCRYQFNRKVAETRYENICIVCGKKFRDKNSKRKFCSRECRLNKPGTQKRSIRKCIICGKEYNPKYKDQQCCSSKCSHIKGGKTVTDQVLSERPWWICLNCDNQFQNKKGETDRTSFCSRECADEYGKKVDHPSSKVYFPECEICGERFTARSITSKTCSNECRREYERKQRLDYYHKHKNESLKRNRNKYRKEHGLEKIMRECIVCGEIFGTWYPRQICCSPKCTKKHGNAFSRQKRRLLESEQFIEYVDIKKIFFRDHGRCQICGRKLNLKRNPPHPLTAVRDHVIPLSKGGEHSYRNVQLACWNCNSNKGDQVAQGADQLRLF